MADNDLSSADVTAQPPVNGVTSSQVNTDQTPVIAKNIATARANGASWDEINDTLYQQRLQAKSMGISDKEFNETLGIPVPPESQQYFSLSDIAKNSAKAFIDYPQAAWDSLKKDWEGENNNQVPQTNYDLLSQKFHQLVGKGIIPLDAFNTVVSPIAGAFGAGTRALSYGAVNMQAAIDNKLNNMIDSPEQLKAWQQATEQDFNLASMILGAKSGVDALASRAKTSPMVLSKDTLDAATSVTGKDRLNDVGQVANNLHDNWVKTGEPPLQAAQRAQTDPIFHEELHQPQVKTPDIMGNNTLHVNTANTENPIQTSSDSIRMYRGIGKNIGNEGNEGDLQFYTTNLEKAKKYGNVYYVDVLKSEMGHFAQGHGGEDEFVGEKGNKFDKNLKPYEEITSEPRGKVLLAANIGEDTINISEGPLSRKPALKNVPEFENQLFQLRSNQTADKLDAIKTVEKLPDVPNSTWEKLYHYSEDKGIMLTKDEQQIYDEHVKPVHEENAKLFNQLEDKGFPEFKNEENPDEAGYVPRYVQNRTKSLGEILDRAKNGLQSTFSPTSSKSLRSTIDAQKARRFYSVTDPETGEKSVVYINTDHQVLGFKEPGKPSKIGNINLKPGEALASGKDVKIGKQTFTLGQATTKDIEASTNVTYSKNVIANELDQNVKLKSALRNSQYLEAMKNSPDFKNIAIEVNKTSTPPEGWRTPKLIQFRNYYMEPKLANALDDFAKDMNTVDGLSHGLLAIQRASNRVMFLNPLPHIENVFNHFMVEKGLVGNIINSPSTVKNLVKAVGEINRLGPKYMEALRTGASMPYGQFLSEDLNDKLIAKMGNEIGLNPGYWSDISSKLGYLNPVQMFQKWSDISQHALWYANDVMTTSRMMQLQEKGLSVEDSIRQTEHLIPNYRVPSEVLGQRWLAQMFNNPFMARFGRYGYNKLAGFFNTLADPVTTKGFANKAKAIDRLAMLGVYMYVLYPMFDKAWQNVTGNPNASESRSGMAQVAQSFMDTWNGDKNIGDLPLSLYTPGLPVEMPVELGTGRYLWNGKPIIRQGDVNEGRPQAAYDAINYLAGKFSYLGQGGNIAQGKMTPEQFGLGLLSVKSPSNTQSAIKEKYKQKDAESAKYRANALEKQRDE